MKIRVYKDELYPFYNLCDTDDISGTEREITDKEYKLIKKAQRYFTLSQQILKKAYR